MRTAKELLLWFQQNERYGDCCRPRRGGAVDQSDRRTEEASTDTVCSSRTVQTVVAWKMRHSVFPFGRF